MGDVFNMGVTEKNLVVREGRQNLNKVDGAINCTIRQAKSDTKALLKELLLGYSAVSPYSCFREQSFTV